MWTTVNDVRSDKRWSRPVSLWFVIGASATLWALIFLGLDWIGAAGTTRRIWLAWHGEELVGAATARDELTSWLRYMDQSKGSSFPPLEDIRLEAVPNRADNEGGS
jgi:hypothetical protein